jgi:hypothetical protein
MRKNTILRAAFTAAVFVAASSAWIGTAAGQAKPEQGSQAPAPAPAAPQLPTVTTAALITGMATITKIDKTASTVTRPSAP